MVFDFKVQDSRIAPSNYEQKVIQKLKGELPEEEQKHRRKRKKPSGPNPLSVKKKRKLDRKAASSDKKVIVQSRYQSVRPSDPLIALPLFILSVQFIN